jgi:hypothetical protein
VVEYAKTGRAKCKLAKCSVEGKKIGTGDLRVGKMTKNPFDEDGDLMANWYHPVCIFKSFKRARKSTKIITSSADCEGFETLKEEDQQAFLGYLSGEGLDDEAADDAKGDKGSKATKKKAPAKKRKKKGDDDDDDDDDDAGAGGGKKSKAGAGKKKAKAKAAAGGSGGGEGEGGHNDEMAAYLKELAQE